MTNPYYSHTSYPSTRAAGSSAAMRAELDLISAGFDLLPTLSGNGGKIVVVNASGTALEVAASALSAYALLASPTFTGTPAAPTAAVDTNTTQIATTAFVIGQGYAKLASPALTGTATYGGKEIGFRGLPAASVTTGAFVAADAGKCVYATAGVTIPNSTMSAEDVVVVQNTTGSGITITKTVSTAYDTSSGSTLGATFTLAARGRMAIVFTSGTVCYVSGNIS